MRVFRVEFEVSHYQTLIPDVSDAEYSSWRSMVQMDGRPKARNWRPPPVYVENPLLPRPDIWSLWGAAAVVAPANRHELLSPFLLASGELLPLPFQDEMFAVCNVTTVVDCLDDLASQRRESGVITRYEFLRHRLPEVPLFKLPGTARVEILCCESSADPQEEFPALVETHGLTGVRFVQLWQG